MHGFNACLAAAARASRGTAAAAMPAWMYAWTTTLLSPLLLAWMTAAPQQQQFGVFLAPSHSPIEQTAAWQM
eukprot:SAG11_NODE_35694_length_265_cov_0.933735_1_plen_71_part_10